MQNKKEVNYYTWNDEPIEANYYAEINLPNGGRLHTNIGKINIEKGDVIYIDYGSSLMEYTRSGKGPQAQYPYGKIQLYGIPASIILNETKCTVFTKNTKENLEILIQKQTERVNNAIPELTEKFISLYMEREEKNKSLRIAQKLRNKELVNIAVDKMEAFFNKSKI